MVTLGEAVSAISQIEIRVFGSDALEEAQLRLWSRWVKVTKRFLRSVCEEHNLAVEELRSEEYSATILGVRSEAVFQEIRACFIFGASRN